jgi:hypothetical protein
MVNDLLEDQEIRKRYATPSTINTISICPTSRNCVGAAA